MQTFEAALNKFAEWRKRSDQVIEPMLWQIEIAGFILIAYNDHMGRMVLFQVFQNGGFKAYTHVTNFVEQYKLQL